MKRTPSDEIWRVRLIWNRMPWGNKPVRPAEVGDELCSAMLAQENVLEDANYQKISPNRFVVEIGEANYALNFQLLEDQIIHQWIDKLLAHFVDCQQPPGPPGIPFCWPTQNRNFPGRRSGE